MFMGSMLNRAVSGALMVLCAMSSARGENKSKAYQEARSRALELASVRTHIPVRIRAKVSVYAQGARHGSVDGAYELVQVSKDDYSERLAFQYFSATTIHREGTRWVVRSAIFEPLLVSYVRQLLAGTQSLPEKLEIDAVDTIPSMDGRQKCYAKRSGPFEVDFGDFRTCFDVATGALLSVRSTYAGREQEYEYWGFIRDGENWFPGKMRRFDSGSLSVEVKIEDIDHAAPAATILDVPAGALKIADCKKFEPAHPREMLDLLDVSTPSKKIVRVVIAVSVDEKGKMGDMQVQQSVNPQLDDLARKKATSLSIGPAKCDGQPIPAYVRMYFMFSPDLRDVVFETVR